MNEKVTYGQLRQLLFDLGFADISIKDSHAGFRHEDDETVILLAVHDQREPARIADVKYVRRVLDASRGVIKVVSVR